MPRLRATGSKKDSSIELRPIGLALRALSQKGLCPTKRGQYTKGTKPQPKKYKEESSLGFLVPFCDPQLYLLWFVPFLLCKARRGKGRSVFILQRFRFFTDCGRRPGAVMSPNHGE